MRLKLFRRGVSVYVEIPDMAFHLRRVPRLALKEAVKEHGQWIVFVDQRRRFRKRGLPYWVIGKGTKEWDTLNIFNEDDEHYIPF